MPEERESPSGRNQVNSFNNATCRTFLHYGNDPYWMTKPTLDGSCTAEEIGAAAQGHFVTSDVTLREDNRIPLAGIVSLRLVYSTLIVTFTLL